MNHNLFLRAFAFVLVLLAGAIYWPGSSGPFIFDDFPNLSPLGASGGVSDLQTLMQFLATGFSGPTGRPVSLLSFLLNANTWPVGPESFKKTNILLHLLVGLSLIWLITLFLKEVLQRSLGHREFLLILACSAWWLAHPLWVSTVLYVVQRMAILAALFSLLSLVFYLKARAILFFESGESARKGIAWLVLSALSVCLAVLSKENAFVLPAMFLIIEVAFFVFGRSGNGSLRSSLLILFSICTVAISAYLIRIAILNWDVVNVRRDFSTGDRFWTQGRVLWIYLYDLMIPKFSTPGLFHQIEVSRGPFKPMTGVLGWFLIACLLFFSAKYIKKLPFTFLSIWLFFSAHLIESTVVSLEIYFEHRNYLPALFVPLIFIDVYKNLESYRKYLIVFFVVMLVIQSFFLSQRVGTWTSYHQMVQVWAKQAPTSLRANLEVSRVMLDNGDFPAALHYFEAAEKIDDQSVVVQLWKLFLTCRVANAPDSRHINLLSELLRVAPENGTTMQYLGHLAEGSDGGCPQLSFKESISLLNAYRSSPSITGSRSDARLQILLGMVYSRAGSASLALEYFSSGAGDLSSANSGMLGVSWLAREGHYREALVLLDYVSVGIREGRLKEHGVDYGNEIRRIRENLEEDVVDHVIQQQ